MLRTSLYLSLLTIFGAQTGYAESLALGSNNSSNASVLEDITVTSTRTQRRIIDTPNTVTKVSRQRREELGARDIKDLFRDELGVSVRRAPTRFSAALGKTGRAGNEGINIRGLEGNQVLILVDGIRLPNSFEFSSFSTGRGDFINVNGIRSVEILRGPASIQYGSDGLAGVVNFQTLNVDDLIKTTENHGGLVSAGYASIDRSWYTQVGLAGKNEQVSGMLVASYQAGHEVDNQAENNSLNSTRTKPNPVDYNDRYVLAKGSVLINTQHEVSATLEAQERRQDTVVYSSLAVPPLRVGNATAAYAEDVSKRHRVSLQHLYKNVESVLLDQLTSTVYWQDASVRQFSLEERHLTTTRTRDNRYSSKLIGLSSIAEKKIAGAVKQRWSYGVDLSRQTLEGKRDGTIPPPNESFPSLVFPTTDYMLGGLFIQNEIDTSDFSIIPGLRFDYYRLNPKSSPLYSGEAVSLSDQAVTPRIGVVWRLDDSFTPFFQWAKGFRAPTPDQVNNGFSNPAVGYRSIANPNLKAEKANSIEIGVRGKVDKLSYSLTYFNNDYKDFISQQRVSGAGTVANPTVFQYVNLAEAHIHGLEFRSEWAFHPNWKSTLGFAYAKGNSEENGVSSPLDTINPLKLLGSLRYENMQWGGQVTVTHQAGKKSDRIAPLTGNSLTATVEAYAPGSYSTVDLSAFWKLERNLRVNMGINNLFNEKYWRWSDVRGLEANSPILDAYSAPGRNAYVNIQYSF